MKRMLVAIDGSRGSKKALQYAMPLAKSTGSTLVLLQVVDLAALLAPGMADSSVTAAPFLMATRDALRRAAAAMVEKAASQCRRKGIKTTTAVRTGSPVEEIIREAGKQKSELIVVGSAGLSAIKAAVLGSVAYGVIHRSSRIPVLVVKQ